MKSCKNMHLQINNISAVLSLLTGYIIGRNGKSTILKASIYEVTVTHTEW